MEVILDRGWLPLIAIVLAACSDVQETAYSDADAARADRAFERGWLPDPLPSSARNIREGHNLDTNEGWLTLQYSPDEAALDRMYIDGGWSAVATDRYPTLPLPDPPVKWWPDRLRRSNDSQVSSMQVFTRADELDHQWWVLVLPNENRLLAWHARR